MNTRRRQSFNKIADNNKRYQCFSKRKKGLYSTAMRCATDFQCEVAIVTRTASGQWYTFSNTSEDTLWEILLQPILESQKELKDVTHEDLVNVVSLFQKILFHTCCFKCNFQFFYIIFFAKLFLQYVCLP